MTSRPRVTTPAVSTALPAAATDGDALLDALRRIARMVAESLDLREVFARVAEATRSQGGELR